MMSSWILIYLLEYFLTYYYVNNYKYFYLSNFLSWDDTILPLFNVKRNLLIFIKIQDRNVFFLFLNSLKLLNLVQ